MAHESWADLKHTINLHKRSFCSSLLIVVSMVLFSLAIGTFVGIKVADNMIKSRVGESDFESVESKGHSQTEEAKFVANSKVADVIKTNQTMKNLIHNAKGSIRSQLRLNHLKCTEVEFDGTFDNTPGTFSGT